MNPIEKARELAHCDTCDTCDNSNYLIPSKNCILKIDLSIAMQMYQWTKEQFLNTDFILKILQLNSNIQDRSNPHWIAKQILKQLEEQYDNQIKSTEGESSYENNKV